MSNCSERMNDAELWALEREFWLGDAHVYENRLASEAILVLPEPSGVLTRSQTIHAIRQSPRWNEVSFESTHTMRPTANVVLLAYEAIGQRDGTKIAYQARCSSIYIGEREQWMLIFHQQTPF